VRLERVLDRVEPCRCRISATRLRCCHGVHRSAADGPVARPCQESSDVAGSTLPPGVKTPTAAPRHRAPRGRHRHRACATCRWCAARARQRAAPARRARTPKPRAGHPGRQHHRAHPLPRSQRRARLAALDEHRRTRASPLMPPRPAPRRARRGTPARRPAPRAAGTRRRRGWRAPPRSRATRTRSRAPHPPPTRRPAAPRCPRAPLPLNQLPQPRTGGPCTTAREGMSRLLGRGRLSPTARAQCDSRATESPLLPTRKSRSAPVSACCT